MTKWFLTVLIDYIDLNNIIRNIYLGCLIIYKGTYHFISANGNTITKDDHTDVIEVVRDVIENFRI